MSEQALQVVSRDIDTITGEIKEIQSRAQSLAVMYAVEIGRRLKEAKEILPHGEWGKWLSERVEFTQRTAQNFMKICDEYGGESSPSYLLISNTKHVSHLPYSKALQLLAVPAEEREEFVQENDVHSMSREELDRAIKERDEAREEARRAQEAVAAGQKAVEDANALREESLQATARAQELVEAAEKRAKESAEEAEAAKAAAKQKQERAIHNAVNRALKEQADTLAKTTEDLNKARERLAELEADNAEKAARVNEAAEDARKEAEAVAEREKEALLAQISALERKVSSVGDPSIQRFGLLFEQFQNNFAELQSALDKIEAGDVRSKLQSALCTLLDRFCEGLKGGACE